MTHPNLPDTRFCVPFSHRLLFTQDVFHGEQNVLAGCLEPSGDQIPKVQFWLDRALLGAGGGLHDDVLRLPTTTLGQADSGVGVKNAVNR